jgi:hypothetical protein
MHNDGANANRAGIPKTPTAAAIADARPANAAPQGEARPDDTNPISTSTGTAATRVDSGQPSIESKPARSNDPAGLIPVFNRWSDAMRFPLNTGRR